MTGGSADAPADEQTSADAVGGLVVLVVDHDPTVRAEVARTLTLAGHEVAVAADGREALRLVADGRVRPEVVVTGIEMPGMTGIELTARLLALRPALRVVMTTGDPARADAARGHPSIVDDVLLKPVRAEALLRAVRPAASPRPRDRTTPDRTSVR